MMDNDNVAASKFIEDNYSKLVSDVTKFGVKENVADELVSDVYFSILKNESVGLGYNPNKGNHTSVITVSEFVYARLKGYSKNEKYHNGDIVTVTIDWYGESKSLDEVRIETAVADNDELEFIEDNMAVRDYISHILSFESIDGISMNKLLKNLLELVEIADRTVLDGIRHFASLNKDFEESLREVIKFAANYPNEYKSIIRGV
jgi:hypothetical protein